MKLNRIHPKMFQQYEFCFELNRVVFFPSMTNLLFITNCEFNQPGKSSFKATKLLLFTQQQQKKYCCSECCCSFRSDGFKRWRKFPQWILNHFGTIVERIINLLDHKIDWFFLVAWNAINLKSPEKEKQSLIQKILTFLFIHIFELNKNFDN